MPPSSGNTPTNFGPYIAAIPANYKVEQGLICPAFAVLQGSANISAATPGGSTPIPGNPPVRIFAGNT
ncbi:MAG: hypothetical protein ACRELF_28235, partial [Gemmataceae bacterium]